jgi:hypothetical protein
MKIGAPRLPKLRPIDYVFLIGGPLAFFLIAFFGLRAVVGPIPQPSAVQRIKDGEVKSGENFNDVLKLLGQPKSIVTHDDGSMTAVYTRTVADGDLQVEDGIITVDPTGHVQESHVERQQPRKTPASPSPPTP